MESTPITPPQQIVGSPVKTATAAPTANWSGSLDVEYANDYYDAESGWYEPDLYSSACSSPELAVWTGIGGWGATDPLGQDGTGDNLGFANNEFWWTDDAQGLYVQDAGLGSSLADQIFTETYWDQESGYGVWYFYMYDFTSNQSTEINDSVPNSDYSGDSVESVYEAPTIATDTYADLSNYGENTTWAGYFNDYGGVIDQYFMNMYKQGNTSETENAYVDSGSINSSTGAFNDTQNNCHTEYP